MITMPQKAGTSDVVLSPSLTCYGIDVGKTGHVAARRNEQTPPAYRKRKDDTFPISNDAPGFNRLLADIREHGGPESCCILIEPTGHYSQVLRQFLREHHITVYTIQPKQRYGKNKNDRRDARALADILYNQLVLGAYPADEREHVHTRLPPIKIAREMNGIIHRLAERERRRTQLTNKLTAISDQLFPEFIQVYKSPHSPSALALREQFPTPQAIAQASLADLCATRLHYQPGRKQLAELQELAHITVGLKDEIVVSRLCFEQKQIIEELHLLDQHIEQIKARIIPLLDASREAQILMSFPGVSYVQAAILLAGIGNFHNFETYGDLCGLAGWRPFQNQTGSTVDSTNLKKAGNMLLKRTLCLIVFYSIQHDPTWKALYERLVQRKCHYDERKKIYVGKMKVVGRIAGQLLRVIFYLINRDYALISSLPPGAELPAPQLYDPAKHVVRLK
jgi:transposase